MSAEGRGFSPAEIAAPILCSFCDPSFTNLSGQVQIKPVDVRIAANQDQQGRIVGRKSREQRGAKVSSPDRALVRHPLGMMIADAHSQNGQPRIIDVLIVDPLRVLRPNCVVQAFAGSQTVPATEGALAARFAINSIGEVGIGTNSPGTRSPTLSPSPPSCGERTRPSRAHGQVRQPARTEVAPRSQPARVSTPSISRCCAGR